MSICNAKYGLKIHLFKTFGLQIRMDGDGHDTK